MTISNPARAFGRRAGFTTLALAGLATLMPTVASAQDWGSRGARMQARAEARVDGRQERGERMRAMQQRQSMPNASMPAPVSRAATPSVMRNSEARGPEGRGRGDFSNRAARQQRDGQQQWQQRQWQGRDSVRTGRPSRDVTQSGNTAGVAQAQQPSSWGTYRPAEQRQRSAEQWRERRENAQRQRPSYQDRDAVDNRRQERDRRSAERWRNQTLSGSTWQGDRSNGGWNNSRNESWRGNRAWSRDWRNNDRYNWSAYRTQNRGIYRPGRYYAPYNNYSYRRLGIGYTLGSLFYRQSYWLNDPWSYRLPDVYGPYRWVRYYDDVMLVDTYTGQVVDVIYDFFW